MFANLTFKDVVSFRMYASVIYIVNFLVINHYSITSFCIYVYNFKCHCV